MDDNKVFMVSNDNERIYEYGKIDSEVYIQQPTKSRDIYSDKFLSVVRIELYLSVVVFLV